MTENSGMKLDDYVEKYIQLRDKKAELKKEFTAKTANIDEILDKIEALILKTFNETGLSSISTDFGTAFVSSRSSATVADWDSFFQFVQEGKNWDFLERRCSKEAVVQYKAANEELPPGINWSETKTVSIRRK